MLACAVRDARKSHVYGKSVRLGDTVMDLQFTPTPLPVTRDCAPGTLSAQGFLQDGRIDESGALQGGPKRIVLSGSGKLSDCTQIIFGGSFDKP